MSEPGVLSWTYMYNYDSAALLNYYLTATSTNMKIYKRTYIHDLIPVNVIMFI